MTQLILSAMDSDEIDSITDTVESVQVTTLIKNVYYDMATELDLPEHETFFELDASGDNNLPALMTIPTNVVKLSTIEYDNKESGDTYPDWQPVTFMDLKEFSVAANSLREETSNVTSMAVQGNAQTHEFLCWTNVQPSYYTSYNDYTLLFNSYDSSIDTTLQQSKTRCHGSIYPVFTISDAFAPDLDPTQFSYFIQRCKVRAFAELKQLPHQEAQTEARNQKIGIQRKQRRTPNLTELQRAPQYGRK
jgi:hypothetical protein